MAHYLHSNSVRQSLFLEVSEWHTLRGKKITIGGEELSLQKITADQALRKASDAEIETSGEVPKLRRSLLNTNVFVETCRAVALGQKYEQRLEANFGAVWATCPARRACSNA